MPTNINEVSCNKTVKGTGLVSCELRFGQPLTILRVDPSWSLNLATETFNLAYVLGKIQDGTFTPFLNTVEFTEGTPEPTTKEYQGGDMAVIRNGKPQYTFEFDNGLAWHRAASSYNGFQDAAVIMIDKTGNALVQTNIAGTVISGFGVNMFNTRTYRMRAGDNTSGTIVEFQIRNEVAFNNNNAIISVEEIGADLNEEIKGIIDVVITGTATTTTATIQVNGSNNTIFGIGGAGAENFRIRNITDDSVVAILTAPSGANMGAYTLTYAAQTAGDIIVIEMYDDESDTNVALVEPNRLYRGASAEITVTA